MKANGLIPEWSSIGEKLRFHRLTLPGDSQRGQTPVLDSYRMSAPALVQGMKLRNYFLPPAWNAMKITKAI
jgi:hypothetical protein